MWKLGGYVTSATPPNFLLVSVRIIPFPSVRKAMLLFPPLPSIPKYFSRNRYVSCTSVTVRFRWFRFTGSPPAWRASRRPHGTRLPVPHAAPHELRLPPSGTTRDRARCSSSSRPARSGGSATKTASSRGDRPAAAASLRRFLLVCLRLRDHLGQGRVHGLLARGARPLVANHPVR